MLSYIRRVFSSKRYVVVHYEVYVDGKLIGKGHLDVSYFSDDVGKVSKTCVDGAAAFHGVDAGRVVIVGVYHL